MSSTRAPAATIHGRSRKPYNVWSDSRDSVGSMRVETMYGLTKSRTTRGGGSRDNARPASVSCAMGGAPDNPRL